MKYAFLISMFCVKMFIVHAQSNYTINSPDKNITVTCNMPQGTYTIAYKGKQILDDSKLGVIRSDEDFSQNLKAIKVSAPVTVKDNYTMLTAKKKDITYIATQRIIETQSASGKKMNIIFRV